MDIILFCNSFVRARVAKTAVIDNSLNPKWDETFRIEVNGKILEFLFLQETCHMQLQKLIVANYTSDTGNVVDKKNTQAPWKIINKKFFSSNFRHI